VGLFAASDEKTGENMRIQSGRSFDRPDTYFLGGFILAATWIKPIHAHKGSSIAQIITDRLDYVKDKNKTGVLDYAQNPDKTAGGEYVTAYACTPQMADMEFLLSKKEYLAITGRTQENDILAYHIRQSFKPGEITPEKANELGQELARKFTKNTHAFIVATHVDRQHVHNHVIFNSTAIDSTRKFHNPRRSNRVIRRISDQICLEHGLSVIENPKPSRGHYGTWLAAQKLELLIDLQNCIKAQSSPGYAHWAKIFSLKQAAKTLLFLQENGLGDMAKLQSAVRESKADFNVLQSEILTVNARLEQISTLQKHIGAYAKSKDKSDPRRRAAKEYFNRLNLKKLPSIKALQQEYAALSAERGTLYKDYHIKRKFMREVLTAKQNAEMMLMQSTPVRDRQRGHHER
jgi:hypothetical protein